ncbi:MAG: hypothetical protein ABI597_11960 [Gammaproteobacteria bacterium]
MQNPEVFLNSDIGVANALRLFPEMKEKIESTLQQKGYDQFGLFVKNETSAPPGIETKTADEGSATVKVSGRNTLFSHPTDSPPTLSRKLSYESYLEEYNDPRNLDHTS